MSRRRRLNPPWLPGLWPLLAFLLLLASIFGFYYALAQGTRFERLPEKAATDGKNKLRYMAGKDAKMYNFMNKLLGYNFILKMNKMFFKL